MKLKIDTSTASAREASALLAALVVIYGDAITDALPGDKPATLAETLRDHASPEVLAAIVSDAPAADGYPTEEEPDAATAFGATPPSDEGRDSAGIPWDERIHSSTKGTNKDGTWSRRRNTDEALFQSVMAELKGNAAAPASTATAETLAPTPPAASGSPVTPPPPPPPPPAAGAAINFPMLMIKITKGIGAGKITKDQVAGILGNFGIANTAGLNAVGADTLAAVNAMVDEHVGV